MTTIILLLDNEGTTSDSLLLNMFRFDFSSQLRDDFQSPMRIRFTPDLGLADRFDKFTRSHHCFLMFGLYILPSS